MLMKAGRPARFDYEYERNGTANLFMMFAPLEGWRFEWHYTPKHGSWLDLAESELGVLTSQCLDRMYGASSGRTTAASSAASCRWHGEKPSADEVRSVPIARRSGKTGSCAQSRSPSNNESGSHSSTPKACPFSLLPAAIAIIAEEHRGRHPSIRSDIGVYVAPFPFVSAGGATSISPTRTSFSARRRK